MTLDEIQRFRSTLLLESSHDKQETAVQKTPKTWAGATPAESADDSRTGTRLVTDGGQPSHGALSEDLTAFRRDILLVLARHGAQYGLAIKRALQSRYDLDASGDSDGEVNHGRLYPNLDDLVHKGLVSKSKLDERTNEYALTAAGRRFIREEAQLWMGGAEQLNSDIESHAPAAGGDD